MAQVKTTSYIDEVMKHEAAERLADRDAMLETMHEENKSLYRRVEFLEAVVKHLEGGVDK